MSKKIKELNHQYNNYIYPKPCEDINAEWILKNKYLQGDPNYHCINYGLRDHIVEKK